MLNVEGVMAIVRQPDFRQRLLEDNQRSVAFYNGPFGFGDFKRVFADSAAMSGAEIFRLCDLFFTEDRIRAIVDEERGCAERNPFYGSSFQPIGAEFFGGLVLASTDDFTVMLLALDGYEVALAKQRTAGQRRTLSFGGQEVFLKFYRGNGFTLQSWRIDRFTDADDLAALTPVFHPGETLVCDAGAVVSFGADESFEYTAGPGSSALVLQIQMHRGGLPMALEFDVDTRELVGASSPAQEPTRLQMLATAMRLFGRADAGDQMERLLEHPDHYVRWHAMREFLGLDLDRAWPHLLRMRDSDAQAAVRRAAVRTVEMIGAPTAIAAE